MTDLLERLWQKTTIVNGCWVRAGRPNSGYSSLKISGRMRYAHRLSYELLVGPIPDGLQIDHLCRVRGCWNPQHLEAVTPRTNTLRGTAPSAIAATQNVCQRGHEFTPENTYTTPAGKRQCRECQRLRERLLYHKRRPTSPSPKTPTTPKDIA